MALIHKLCVCTVHAGHILQLKNFLHIWNRLKIWGVMKHKWCTRNLRRGKKPPYRQCSTTVLDYISHRIHFNSYNIHTYIIYSTKLYTKLFKSSTYNTEYPLGKLFVSLIEIKTMEFCFSCSYSRRRKHVRHCISACNIEKLVCYYDIDWLMLSIGKTVQIERKCAKNDMKRRWMLDGIRCERYGVRSYSDCHLS